MRAGNASPTGNLAVSQPSFFEPPRWIGERRKRWTRSLIHRKTTDRTKRDSTPGESLGINGFDCPKKAKARRVRVGLSRRGKLSNPCRRAQPDQSPTWIPFHVRGGQSSAVAQAWKDQTMFNFDPKKERKRAPMCEATYAEIRARLALGELQHDIAADLGINQGRISEVNTGKRGDPHQASLF